MNTLYTKLKHLPIYLLILMTMGVAGFEKLLDLEVPDWFIKQFSGSAIDFFLNALPVMWIMIMIMQIAAFLFTLLAILRKEFQDNVSKKWSLPAFFVTEVTFIILGFGQRITQQYDASFWLFAYTVLTYLAARIIIKNYDKTSEKISLQNG